MVFIVIVLVFLVFVIVINIRSGQREEENYEILAAVRTRYKSLIAIIITSYDLKICPKCYERHMDLLTVSPTGQSVEYFCINCKKKLTGKLLPQKDSTDAVRLYNEIKRKLSSIEKPLSNELFNEDAHSDFFINLENGGSRSNLSRESISESVRHEVWRRDQGKCITCGSQYNLEFDHIIPISKGGSNTARNIQLLCETCNRSKSNKI